MVYTPSTTFWMYMMGVDTDWVQAWMYVLPLTVMALDIVSGFAAGWGSLNSTTMREGLKKKLGMVLVLALTSIIDVFQPSLGLDHQVCFTAIAAVYIGVMEILSVLENCGSLWPVFQDTKLYQFLFGKLSALEVVPETAAKSETAALPAVSGGATETTTTSEVGKDA